MKEFFKYYGIELTFLIAGICGGVLAMSKDEHRKKSVMEKFFIVLGGTATAVYITPLVIWVAAITIKYDVPGNVQFGIAFLTGLGGLSLAERITSISLALFRKYKKLDENDK